MGYRIAEGKRKSLYWLDVTMPTRVAFSLGLRQRMSSCALRLHRRQRSSAIGHAGHLSHLGEAKQIGDNRLTAAVLVRTVPMEAIATTSGLDVHKRQRQIVASSEPGKSARRTCPPFGCAVRAPGCEARRDCRRRLERLLIEGRRRRAVLPEGVGADGPKKPRWRRLHIHQPPKS